MTTTDKMGLDLPTPNITVGPDWANKINDALETIDGHNHSVGQGNQIGVSGLNIQSELPLNGQALGSVKQVKFANQTSSLALSGTFGIYALNGNLYFNTGATDVQITNGASIVGATGNINGLTGNAAVNYSGVQYNFFSNTATSTYGDIRAQDFTLTNNSSGNTVKLTQAASSSYVLSFPTVLPGSVSVVTLDGSGQIASTTSPTLTSLTVSGGATVVGTATVGSLSSSGSVAGTAANFTTITGSSLTTDNVAIKHKRITGTTDSSGSLLIAHSLDWTKILNVTVSIQSSGGSWYSIYTNIPANRNWIVGFSSTNVDISSDVIFASRPVRILITYEA